MPPLTARPLRNVLAQGLLAASLLLSGCLPAHRNEQHPPSERAPEKPPTPTVSSAPAAVPSPPHAQPAPPPAAPKPGVGRTPSPTKGRSTATRGELAQRSSSPKAPQHPPPATPPKSPAAPTETAPGKPPAAASPALDLTGLEQRLRDTPAIGIFAKLTLKNQVDDLLSRFRVYHSGHSDIKLDQLRQSYDLLLLKVLSLLQTKDAALARDISASRQAIWNVLVDPKKFAAISQ